LFLYVTGSFSGLILLQHLSLVDLPITRGLSFSPVIEAHNATVILSLECFPPASSSPDIDNLLTYNNKIYYMCVKNEFDFITSNLVLKIGKNDQCCTFADLVMTCVEQLEINMDIIFD
jgi:hypothetical protein